MSADLSVSAFPAVVHRRVAINPVSPSEAGMSKPIANPAISHELCVNDAEEMRDTREL
jgi:hypothetical protein